MTTKGFKGITVKQELYDALMAAYEAEFKGKRLKPSFSGWLSEKLWKDLEK